MGDAVLLVVVEGTVEADAVGEDVAVVGTVGMEVVCVWSAGVGSGVVVVVGLAVVGGEDVEGLLLVEVLLVKGVVVVHGA